MSGSSRVPPLLLAAAALGGLGVVMWWLLPDGRTAAGPAGPAVDRPVIEAETATELVRPETVDSGSPPPEEVESSRHEGWTLATLRGRVTEKESERPLADVVVRVDGPDEEPIGGARTDEEGRFELALAAPPELVVRALPRRGLIECEPPHAIVPEERLGEEEIELHLARGTSAPVSGVVVNRRTSEGVFTVRVELSMPGEGLRESVVTDGQGNFAGEIAFPPGALTATVIDEPPGEEVALGTFRREHLEDGRLPDAWALEVDVGPSYLLDSTSGAALGAGFVAEIVETDPRPRYAAVLRVTWIGLVLEDTEELARTRRTLAGSSSLRGVELEEAGWPTTPVRPGSPPWIRYPRQHVEPAPADEPREISLLVTGAEGWLGEARIDQTVGHYPWTVGIPLRACGSLGGRIVETTGEPVSGARVSLFPPGSGKLALQETETNPEGGYSFARVDVGRYRMVVEPERHAGAVREVRIDMGTSALDPIVLPPAPIAGDVAGELFVPARTPHQPPFLTLASAEGSRWREVAAARVSARDERGTVYAFRFANVPSGEYDLSVGHLGLRDGLASFWSPRKQRVYPPRDDLLFECRASEDPRALAFRVLDAGGEPLPRADVAFGPGGWLLGRHDLRPDHVFFVPRDVSLEWRIGARGYRPVRGTEADARREEDRDVIEVRLQRGWGATLHVRALGVGNDREVARLLRGRDDLRIDPNAHGIPVRGARVHADGDFVGRTDREGRIELSLFAMPAEIGIELDGWFGLALNVLGERSEVLEAVLWVAPL